MHEAVFTGPRLVFWLGLRLMPESARTCARHIMILL
jgi:hypothetical protein